MRQGNHKVYPEFTAIEYNLCSTPDSPAANLDLAPSNPEPSNFDQTHTTNIKAAESIDLISTTQPQAPSPTPKHPHPPRLGPDYQAEIPPLELYKPELPNSDHRPDMNTDGTKKIRSGLTTLDPQQQAVTENKSWQETQASKTPKEALVTCLIELEEHSNEASLNKAKQVYQYINQWLNSKKTPPKKAQSQKSITLTWPFDHSTKPQQTTISQLTQQPNPKILTNQDEQSLIGLLHQLNQMIQKHQKISEQVKREHKRKTPDWDPPKSSPRQRHTPKPKLNQTEFDYLCHTINTYVSDQSLFKKFSRDKSSLFQHIQSHTNLQPRDSCQSIDDSNTSIAPSCFNAEKPTIAEALHCLQTAILIQPNSVWIDPKQCQHQLEQLFNIEPYSTP